MADIKYEIIQIIRKHSEKSRGWKKELDLISWNGGKPKYDIRDWHRGMRRWGRELR